MGCLAGPELPLSLRHSPPTAVSLHLAMTTPPVRPRRANANLHPADILLKDKQTRRSSAEVAQEKAALEAKRQALLDQRAAGLQEIAALEEMLQAHAEQESQSVTASNMHGANLAIGGSLPATAIPVSTLRRSGKQATPKLIIAPVTGGGGRGMVVDSVIAGGTGVPVDTLGTKSQSTGKLRRATRADVAAYRGADADGSVTVPDVQATQEGLVGSAGYAVKTGGRQQKRKAAASSTEKRYVQCMPERCQSRWWY